MSTTYRSVARSIAAALVCFGIAGLPSAISAPADVPHDVLKGIEAMRRLPAEGFHIVESQGRLLLVSTNGHYVVSGGRILDLWNQVEITSVADVEATTHMPLARMGIDASALGGVVIGQESARQRVTTFLDPASAESRKVLPLVRELAKSYRLDVVFVPAQPARAPTCASHAGLDRSLGGHPWRAACGRIFIHRNRVSPLEFRRDRND